MYYDSSGRLRCVSPQRMKYRRAHKHLKLPSIHAGSLFIPNIFQGIEDSVPHENRGKNRRFRAK